MNKQLKLRFVGQGEIIESLNFQERNSLFGVSYLTDNIDSFIRQEWTTYQDKFDNDIYENDILKSDKGYYYEVVWDRNNLEWKLEYLFGNEKFTEDSFYLHPFENRSLGNGFLKRRDMEIVANSKINKR